MLASQYDGKRLNSTNDLVYKRRQIWQYFNFVSLEVDEAGNSDTDADKFAVWFSDLLEIGDYLNK